MQDGLKETACAVSLGSIENLDQNQKPEGAGSYPGNRRNALIKFPASFTCHRPYTGHTTDKDRRASRRRVPLVLVVCACLGRACADCKIDWACKIRPCRSRSPYTAQWSGSRNSRQ